VSSAAASLDPVTSDDLHYAKNQIAYFRARLSVPNRMAAGSWPREPPNDAFRTEQERREIAAKARYNERMRKSA
jgi:hypothetical protein